MVVQEKIRPTTAEMGDFGVGGTVGLDGSGAPTAGGSLSYKGYTAGLTWYGGEHEQFNWLVGYKSGDFSVMMSNDIKVGGDKYRTAAVEFGVGPVSGGFNIYTTAPPEREHESGRGGNLDYKSRWGHNVRNTYSSGSRIHAALYMGYNNGFTRSRLGISSPGIQDFIQNGVHHTKLFNSPYFNTSLGTPRGPYTKHIANNPHSSY